MGDIGVLGVTFSTGVTGRSEEGGAGALRGVPKDDELAAPKRDAAACSFRIAISSSDTPGNESVSCLKLNGAEICSAGFSETGLEDLTPMSFCNLAVKARKPPMQLVILTRSTGWTENFLFSGSKINKAEQDETEQKRMCNGTTSERKLAVGLAQRSRM